MRTSIPKHLILFALSLMVVCSCGSRGGRKATNSDVAVAVSDEEEGWALVTVGDTTFRVPIGYSPEDSIAYVENALLRPGHLTADGLLSLAEIHTLDPDDSLTLASYSPSLREALRVANRFMRMHYAASGNADDELQWVDAVRRTLSDYAGTFRCTKAQSLDSLMAAVDYMSAGTQFEMNRYMYIEASVEYYKALDANKALLESVSERQLHQLLLEEYRCWNRLNATRHNVYVNIIRAGDHYSMLPMELEAAYEAYAIFRRENLDIDRDIILNGRQYRLQHPVVRTAEWNDYIHERLYLPEGYDTPKEGDDYYESNIALEFKTAVEAWLKARQAVSRHLTGPRGTSYDNLTADYHWTIVNEAEPMQGF